MDWELVNFIAALIFGFGFIVVGADRFVTGAAATARNFGISPLIIGLTIVGIGTSAPEMLVSFEASMKGTSALAIGNAIGSNITNITLVIGLTALIVPLTVKSNIVKREFPILFAITALGFLLLVDGTLSTLDGYILLAGLGVLIYWIIKVGLKSNHNDPIEQEFADEIPANMSTTLALFWLVVGLVILIVSSKLVVWGGVGFAKYIGISDVVIGLTIIAIGTSLPELAACIASALKNEPDIAIGNIIGSNMFNLLAVLFIPGLIAPGKVPDVVVNRDLYVMAGLTLLFFAMAFGLRKPGRINRYYGFILLSLFIAYQIFLFTVGSGEKVV